MHVKVIFRCLCSIKGVHVILLVLDLIQSMAGEFNNMFGKFILVSILICCITTSVSSEDALNLAESLELELPCILAIKKTLSLVRNGIRSMQNGGHGNIEEIDAFMNGPKFMHCQSLILKGFFGLSPPKKPRFPQSDIKFAHLSLVNTITNPAKTVVHSSRGLVSSDCRYDLTTNATICELPTTVPVDMVPGSNSVCELKLIGHKIIN